MAKESDHLAGTLGTENTGGVLSGVLADENEFDRRALWRIGTWGAAAVGAVVVAVMANQSSIGWRRDHLAAADLSKQAQLLLSVARESENEARRLAAAIDTLNSDRDRLYSRVTALEQGLDSVTGTIARQTSAGPVAGAPVPAPAAPLPAMPAGPTASPTAATAPGSANQPAAPGIAPVVSASPFSTPEKPRIDIARLESKAEIKSEPRSEFRSEFKSEQKPEAKPEPQLKPGAIADAKSESRPESKSESKSDKAKSEPKAEAKSDPKLAEVKVEPKMDPKTDAKTEPKAEPKMEARSDTKPEARGDAKSEAKRDIKTDSKIDGKVDGKVDAKPDAKSDAKSDLASAPSAPAARTLPRIASNPPSPTQSAPAMTAAAVFAPAAGLPEGFPAMIGPPDPAAGKLFAPPRPANAPSSSSTAPVPASNAMASATPKENEKESEKPDEAADANAARLPVQRTEFAVDLGTANSVNGLRALWRGLRFNAALAQLRPVIMVKEGNNGLGMQLRLAAGPLRDAAGAAKICAALAANGRPCETTVFDGQRLAMSAEEAQPPAPLKPAPAGKWGSYRHNGSRHASDNREKEKMEEPPPPAKPPESSSSFSGLFGSKH